MLSICFTSQLFHSYLHTGYHFSFNKKICIMSSWQCLCSLNWKWTCSSVVERVNCGIFIDWTITKQNNKNAACNQVNESHQHNFKEKKLHREEYMICDFTCKNFKNR